jgi:hypothetical protein
VLSGVLTVVFTTAPTNTRYALIDATGIGYTGRFSSVVAKFQVTLLSFPFVPFVHHSLLYPPLLVLALSFMIALDPPL